MAGARGRPGGANRPQRVARVIKEEITLLLQRGDLKDPRIKMATISEVSVSRDLTSAKVYVQVIGTPEERNSTVEGLTSATGFIRGKLGDALRMRSMPQLRFLPDESGERADRVLGLLAGLERERDGGEKVVPPEEDAEENAEDDAEEDAEKDEDPDE